MQKPKVATEPAIDENLNKVDVVDFVWPLCPRTTTEILNHVLEMTDDGLDFLAKPKKLGVTMLVSTQFQSITLNSACLWLPLLPIAKKIPIANSHITSVTEKTGSEAEACHVRASFQLLSSACVECWSVTPKHKHKLFEVYLCKGCDTRGKGLLSKTNAKGYILRMLDIFQHISLFWF